MRTLDILPNNIEIFQSDVIVGTPPLLLMFECYMELLNKNWTTSGVPFKNTSHVIWIENSDKQVMGGICYEYLLDRQEGWIILSFTNPKFRGQGINKLAHEYFERECLSKNMIFIGSIVSTENHQRIQSAKKVGLEPLFYRMIKRL